MGHPPSPTIGVIVGMTSEARCLGAGKRRKGISEQETICVHVTGGLAEKAQNAAKKLVEMNVKALLSFGIAGSLSPDLRPGDLVLPKIVLTPSGEAFQSHAPWRENMEKICNAFTTPQSAPIMGVDEAVTSARDKTRLFKETGACAVDMESHHLARVAAAAKLPFLVIRAIGDPAERTIPKLALAGLGTDGNPRVLPVLGGLMLRPWELPGLLRLASDSAKGLATLGRVGNAALPGLGFS